jgi:hypothetical protein
MVFIEGRLTKRRQLIHFTRSGQSYWSISPVSSNKTEYPTVQSSLNYELSYEPGSGQGRIVPFVRGNKGCGCLIEIHGQTESPIICANPMAHVPRLFLPNRAASLRVAMPSTGILGECSMPVR